MLATKEIEQETYLTTGDVAKRFGVTNQYIQLLAKKGKLPVAMRTAGGIRLFRLSDIEAIAEERRVNPPRSGPAPGTGGRPKKKTRKVAKKKTGVRKKK